MILIGGGGHCSAVADVVRRAGCYDIVGVVDPEFTKGERQNGLLVLGTDDDLPELATRNQCFLLTVGQLKSSTLRRSIFQKLSDSKAVWPVVICPSAVVSASARIGPGTVVFPRAVIGANAKIGCNSIVNSGAIIEHNSVVGDFVHVSTGAIVNGGCRIADDTLIGSNATLREGISVGRGSLIGAATYVNKPIGDGVVAFGNPVKVRPE